MKGIKDWLLNKMLGTYLKGLLGKLPGDGYKTVAGVVVFILGIVIKSLPVYSGLLGTFVDLLREFSAGYMPDAGLALILTGVTHKVLKYFFPKEIND